ncbi:myc-associated zinc finger protein-like [Musca autumnalis]|uniref:myc-associated zinc finger protein-like n=1 Tax=Musca autumnalis TaxID=221902 RepID=UPI003CEF1478
MSKESVLKKCKQRQGDRSQHVCPTCNDVLSSAKNLKRHMLRHLEENPFNCPRCSQGFNRRSQLIMHERTHVKSFKCPECPAMYFISLENLLVHSEGHARSSP